MVLNRIKIKNRTRTESRSLAHSPSVAWKIHCWASVDNKRWQVSRAKASWRTKKEVMWSNHSIREGSVNQILTKEIAN